MRQYLRKHSNAAAYVDNRFFRADSGEIDYAWYKNGSKTQILATENVISTQEG
jgi:hypothetical protein